MWGDMRWQYWLYYLQVFRNALHAPNSHTQKHGAREVRETESHTYGSVSLLGIGYNPRGLLQGVFSGAFQETGTGYRRPCDWGVVTMVHLYHLYVWCKGQWGELSRLVLHNSFYMEVTLTRSNTKQMFRSTTVEQWKNEELQTGPFFWKEKTQLTFWGILRPHRMLRMYCSVCMCEVWAQLHPMSLSSMSAQPSLLCDVSDSGRMQHTSLCLSNLSCCLILWFSASGLAQTQSHCKGPHNRDVEKWGLWTVLEQKTQYPGAGGIGSKQRLLVPQLCYPFPPLLGCWYHCSEILYFKNGSVC